MTTSSSSSSKTTTPKTSQRFNELKNYLGLIAVLIVMCLVFGSLSNHFLSASAFTTIANQIPALVVMSVGMTFILIIGGIDLSVGSVLAFSGAVLSMFLVKMGWNTGVSVVIALLTGTLCGTLVGTVSVFLKIPAFIVSLGMLEMARGGASLATGSQTTYIGEKISFLTAPLYANISLAFIISIIVVILGHILLTRSVLGRQLIGIGTNEEAMRLAGINTYLPKIGAFMLMGFLSALGALFQVSRMETADPNASVGMELQVIAAVVIGGTSLMGGRGSVLASFFGVLIIAVLDAGLAQIGAQEPTKRIITGLVIIAAVVSDMYRTRKTRT